MMYLVKKPLKTDDRGELRPGQRIKTNNREKARQLIEEGVLVPFCYWTDQPVDDCVYPCYKFDGHHKVEECKYFAEYWAKRLKVLEEGGIK